MVAGNLGGRTLAVPKNGTRPTSDRVRQAWFDRLGADVPGAQVLDLFAGSGSLGIEALSRGASQVLFVEAAVAAVRVLRRNLSALALERQAEVWDVTVLRALERLQRAQRRFDLVLADPPYAQDIGPEFRKMAVLVRSGGRIVVERSARSAVLVAPAGVQEDLMVRYGETALQFFRSTVAAEESEESHEEGIDARGLSGHL